MTPRGQLTSGCPPTYSRRVVNLIRGDTMAKSPADIAAKWANRTAQATTEYKQGVEGVSVAPGEAAAAAVHRMVAELQRQLDSGEL